MPNEAKLASAKTPDRNGEGAAHASCRVLFWEQWLIVGVAIAVLCLGVGWGLPSEKRVDLLLKGQELTDRQRSLLASTREARRMADLTKIEARADALFGRELPEQPSSFKTPRVLGEEDRLDALCKFLIHSSAQDENGTYSALSRMNPKKVDLAPRYYIYGGAYLYPIGLVLFLLKGIGLLHVTQDYSYYIAHPSDIARMYVVGRSFNIVALVGTLFLLARLGMRLSGRLAGSSAMLAYLSSTLALDQCLVSKPHVYAAFWFLLGIFLVIRYLDEQRLAYLGLAILSGGWSVGSSLPCVLIVLCFASLLYERRRMREAIGRLTLVALGIATVFAITNPYAILNWDMYLYTLVNHGAAGKWGYAVPSLRKLVVYVERILTEAYGFPMSGIGVATVAHAVVRGRGLVKRVAVGAAGILVTMGLTVPYLRISLFVGPLVALLAGYGLDRGLAGLRWGGWGLKLSIAGMCLLPGVIFAALLARDVIQDEAWYRPTLAWTDGAGINEKTRIGVFGLHWTGQPDPTDTPPFPFVNADVVNLHRYAEGEKLPDWVVVGVFPGNTEKWEAHRLRNRYKLVYELGSRRSREWLVRWRVSSQAWIAARVYAPIDS